MNARDLTASGIVAAISAAVKPHCPDKSFADLRWAIYLKMLGQRDRVVQAANGHGVWYADFDESDFADMEARLEGRLASSLISTTERAECMAALTVIDIARDERKERER